MSEEIAELLRKLIETKSPYMMDYGDEDEFYELQAQAERILEEDAK